MKPYSSIGLSVLLLIVVIAVSSWWANTFYTSLQTHRSPLANIPLDPQPATPPLTNKIIVVVIGGLGYDASLILESPTLGRLRQIGASAAIESIPPTYAHTAWGTLVTGAPPETNDAPPIDIPLNTPSVLGVDTIFARADQANLQTALLGDTPWRRLIPQNHLDQTFFVEAQTQGADAATLEAALPLVKDETTSLVFIHFTSLDVAAQYQGGIGGTAYEQAVNNVDEYLAQIVATLDLNQTTLVVLGDHGHIASGGHGGNEVDTIWQPLIIAGPAVIPGSYSDLYQTDIAPTLTTLLGLSPPTATQGRILFEMFQVDPEHHAKAQISLTQQRLALVDAYLTQLDSESVILPEKLLVDATNAQAALDNKNISGALQLARFTQDEADLIMNSARTERIQREQLIRIPIVGVLLLGWFIMIWRRRGTHAGSIVIAATITLVSYYALDQIQGNDYSISYFSDIETFPFAIARTTSLTILGGGLLMLIFLLLTNESDWLILLGSGYGFVVLVTLAFTLPFFWGYWQNGLVITWYLPEVSAAYWQVVGAIQMLVAGVVGLILPWPVMSLCLFVSLMRQRLNEKQPPPPSDTIEGMHAL
ncbi:MAG: alkaline phosphatase family protein [Chloroflexota bacterium]